MVLRRFFKKTTAVPLVAGSLSMASARTQPPSGLSRQSGLHFIPREFETEADDGTPLYGRGWLLHDEDDLAISEADPRLGNGGILIFKVAGVTFHPLALQQSCFNPGNEVKLVAEPTNPVDANAIAVWDLSLRHQLGYVPRARTSRIRKGFGKNTSARAYVWWDWHKVDCKRCGVKVVVLQMPYKFTPLSDFVVP
jgi:HIRAN domain